MLSENMASLGGEELLSTKSLSVDTVTSQKQEENRKITIDREDRLRQMKDRQNEERLRKLEDLKAQAVAAQKYREQKEEERKRRIEDLRSRELDRKQQVEDRKRAILDAEKERREYIVRKNQERDSRIETKRRNERSSIAFAFGSSTPRLLDPVDAGTVSPSAFWGHRRSTSITNVAFSGAPLSRRSSERELSDTPKKRATSAGGLNRQNEDESTDSSPLSYRSVARRKTDLMPTIPSPRDSNFGSRSSLYCHTPRTAGRAVSMTRLDQLAQPTRRNGEHLRAVIERQRQRQYDAMSNSVTSHTFLHSPTTDTRTMSRSMTHLAGHVSNQNQKKQSTLIVRSLKKTNTSKSMTQLISTKVTTRTTNLKKQHKNDVDLSTNLSVTTGSRSGDVTPGTSRPGSALSTSTSVSGVLYRRPITTTRKPRPASIAGTGMTIENNDVNKQKRDKPPIPRVQNSLRKSSNANGTSSPAKPNETPKRTDKRLFSLKKTASHSPKSGIVTPPELTATSLQLENEQATIQNVSNIQVDKIENETSTIVQENIHENKQLEVESQSNATKIEETIIIEQEEPASKKEIENIEDKEIDISGNLKENFVERQENNEMTASMIAKRVTTEEEAKLALAERRRIAREEAERQAELERQRYEANRLAELQKIAEEEEKQRHLEEETLRLGEEQRKAEELRLLQAIEEAKQREEEERLRKEEEEKSKIEREENERKAREESEKQKLEVAERLKKEEKEREERRKRVEAIMSRTRAKGTPGNTPNKNDEKDNENMSPSNSDISLTRTDNNMEIDNSIKNTTAGVINDYEKSVTDKENALINSLSNLLDKNKISQNIRDINSQNLKINGKVDFDMPNEENLLKISAISNGNGLSGHSLDNKIESTVGEIYSFSGIDNKTQDSITDQLIDINIDLNQTADTVNFNNNSLMTSATLVTPDSHENKEISLL